MWPVVFIVRLGYLFYMHISIELYCTTQTVLLPLLLMSVVLPSMW